MEQAAKDIRTLFQHSRSITSPLNSLCGTLTTRPRNKCFQADLVIERISFGLCASMRRRASKSIVLSSVCWSGGNTLAIRAAAVSDHHTASISERPTLLRKP
jgi:hypothetical protein